MRYSIIHHDLREKYDLTICDYLVLDSIHQVSHISGGCSHSNVKLGEFLGIDESSVRRAKEALQERGLICLMNGKWFSTPIWLEDVTSKARQNAEVPRQNAEKLGKMPITPYIKNIKNNTVESKDSTEPVVIEREYRPTGDTVERDYSFQAHLAKLEKSPQKALRVIAWYWKRKKYKFKNLDQAAQQQKRDIKAATELAKANYPIKEVERVARYCDENYDLWTLETVAKVYHQIAKDV